MPDASRDSVVDAVMQYRQQDAHIFQTKNF